MDPADLDGLLERELRALPPPRAPRTMLPRILAAVRVEASPPTPPTGWFTWSWTRRAACLAALVPLMLAAVLLAADTPASIVRAAEAASSTATLMRAVWDVLLQPVAGYLFGLGVLFALACAAAWAAMEAALGGVSHR
jgi:hypothetical protein